jgi:hypothetical protein
LTVAGLNIIAITGSFQHAPITSGSITFNGSDNTLNPAGPFLDSGGLAFTIGTVPSREVNLYYVGPGYQDFISADAFGNSFTGAGTFTITPVSVPGPIVGGGLPSLLLGGGLLAWWLHRRRMPA